MENRKEAIDKIIAIATSMISGEKNLIEGCRILTGLRFEIDNPDDDAFIVFRGVDSETDGYPLGKVRDGYNTEYLRRLDCDMDRYLEKAKPDIIEACEEIIIKFSKK